MLKKMIVGTLLVQGLLMGSDVRLHGIDTQQKMCVELTSENAWYINKVYYEQSKKDTEVLLDLYWAMQCTTHIEALPLFAKQHESDQELAVLTKLHYSDDDAYSQRVKSIYSSNCEKVEATVAINR